MPNRIKNISGQKFGRLTALRPVGRNSAGCVLWLCQCDCGKETKVACTPLILGRSLSCGCLRHDQHVQRWTTHGGKKHKLYPKWKRMIQRCYSLTDPGYIRYGERGISVYEPWIKDPTLFFEYIESLPDYGEPERSIDRIDNNGDYVPGNLRWATRKQQNTNKRNNLYIEFQGKTQALSLWAEETGIHSDTIRSRLLKGWTPEKALTEPVTMSKKKGAMWSQNS